MKTLKTGSAALLVSCLVCVSFAEDRSAVATEKAGASYDRKVRATGKLLDNTADPTASAEVITNVLVDPGKNVPIDSELDYSSASTVAITLECTACTTAGTALGNSGLVLQARWTVGDSELLVATENKAATAFAYFDAGAAIFNVYGPVFRLVLQNKDANTITIDQITIFRRNP